MVLLFENYYCLGLEMFTNTRATSKAANWPYGVLQHAASVRIKKASPMVKTKVLYYWWNQLNSRLWL